MLHSLRSVKAAVISAVVAAGLFCGGSVASAATPASAGAAPTAGGLAAQTAYVDRVFLAVLHRHAGSTPFPAALANGSLTRKEFVTQVANSQERRLNIVEGFFRNCLGRPAASNSPWIAALASAPLYQVQAGICGSAEAFLHAGRSDLKAADVLIGYAGFGPKSSGHAQAEKEIAAGIAKNGLKKEAVFVFTSEATSLYQLNFEYEHFFNRDVDPTGARTFGPLMPYRGLFTVPVALATSKEFTG